MFCEDNDRIVMRSNFTITVRTLCKGILFAIGFARRILTISFVSMVVIAIPNILSEMLKHGNWFAQFFHGSYRDRCPANLEIRLVITIKSTSKYLLGSPFLCMLFLRKGKAAIFCIFAK